MSKTLKIVGAFAALGAVGALIYFARKARASTDETPETPAAPSTPDLVSAIMAAQNLTELNSYYNQIGGLLNAGKITIIEYDQLYVAYVQRFYQLLGVSV